MHATGDHPPPPWRLDGPFVAAVSLVPVERARAFVPADLALLEIAPGRTLGALGAALYTGPSTLRYAELVVVPALVRVGGRPAAWVSHIYVDSDRSVSGGRAIWGLPKEAAEFTWRVGAGGGALVEAARDGRRLAAIGFGMPRVRVPVPALAPVLGSRAGERLLAIARGALRLAPTTAAIAIPDDSPLAPLGLQRPVVAAAGRLRLTVPPPAAAGTA